MIQFKKDSSGLVEYASQIPFKTVDPKSVNYFRLYDFPDRFYLGKNAFRIAGNSDTLVKDSKIYIDIVDSAGGIIYHEVLDSVGQDNTRTVVVYIYGDTPPGPSKIYIGGRIYRMAGSELNIPYNDNPSDSVNYKHVPNILWVGDANVIPTKTNYEEVIYEIEPTVEYTERIVNYVTPVTHSRSVDRVAISGETVSMMSLTMPSQYGEYNSLYDDSERMSTNAVSPSPLVSNNTGESVPKTQLPEYSALSVLRANSDIFSESMAGGTIRVNSISLLGSAPRDVLNSSYFAVRPNYSASIVRVVNSRAIEVDPPFRYPVEYYTADGNKRTISVTNFVNHSNFTASYYSQDISTTTGSFYETFAEVEFKNLEPSIGTVDKISVSYKPIGSFGDFIDIGEYPVRSNNLLVDRSTLELKTSDGLSVKNIGEIKSSSDVSLYWTSSISGNGISSVSLSRRSNKILNAILVSCTGSFSESDYVTVYPKNSYTIGAIVGTEYELSLSVDSSKKIGDWVSPLIDLYISGSDVTTDLIKSFDYSAPISSPSLGRHIGSISSKGGSLADYTFPFIVKDSSNIIPKIVIRSGEWDIGNISITPRKERGFTPNHAKLNIPLPNLKRQSELILKFDYFNNAGVKSNIGTQVHGVIFSGSNDRGATLPTGLISSSRQFVDQTSPFTGSFTGSFTGNGSGLTGVLITLPPNVVSSSAQISADISGAFNAASSSFSTRVYNLESKSTFTGSFTGSFIGDGTNLSLKANVVSSSAQISTEISGAFNAASSSFSTRVYNLESKSTYTGSFTGSFTGNGTNLSLKANVVSSSAQVDIRSASYSSYVTRTISYVTGHPIANQYYSNTLFDTPQPVIFSSSAKLQNMDVSTEIVSSSYVKLPEAGTYLCEWNVRIHEATGVVWVAAMYGSMDAPSVIYSSSLFSSSIGNVNYINNRYMIAATSSNTFVGIGMLFDNFTTHIPAQNQDLDQSTFLVTQIKRGI